MALHTERLGGGELVDQGMHVLDLSYSVFGPLPLRSALTAHAEYWPMEVEDNAVIVLGEEKRGPWTMFHTSWTEWKNLFSLETSAERRSSRWTASRVYGLSDSPSTR